MAAVMRSLFAVVLAAWLGCGKPVGLNAPVTPLVQIHVKTAWQVSAADGGIDSLDGSVGLPGDGTGELHLHVALVWGQQWLPEPFCVLNQAVELVSTLPPDLKSVVDRGCRDSFGFIPDSAGVDTVLAPDGSATISLISLPHADLMVGDLTSRIAYASLVVYDDRNLDGVLNFRHPQRQRGDNNTGNDAGVSDAPGFPDIVYGASFISMTQPDRRVAYLEGAFNPDVAFYPRGPRGTCPEPPKGFSLLSASGFSLTPDTLASIARGAFPPEQICDSAPIDDTVVIGLQQDPASLAALSQLACTTNDSGGTTFYRRPPTTLDLTDRTWACASFPRLLGDDAGVPSGEQLVVASAPSQPCRGTLHYTLRGCNNDPTCVTPSWDLTAPSSRPSWWPCKVPQ
jgi:hypothetical protein